MTNPRQSDPKTLFGQRLRELRLARGLSQEALGNTAGLDRTYVSSCERGHRNVSLESIHRLSMALGVAPSALFGLSPKEGSMRLKGKPK